MDQAVCYLRVSTEEQSREGVSLQAQEEKLLAYCKLHDLEVVAVVREVGVSGARPLSERPGGQELLALVPKQADHVVALKLDRLFRNAEDALRQTRLWDKASVALHLVDLGGQSVNTKSAMGRMFLTMTAAFAELERNLIAERTALALAHLKEKRQAYSPTPYGFDRQGDALLPNPEEQKVVTQVLSWRKQGWTLRRIAKELTDQGIPTKTGGRWHACTVNYLLKNQLYREAA